MVRTSRKIGVAMAICCCVALPASAEEPANEAQAELPETKLVRGSARTNCFRIDQIRNFEVLDPRNMLVFAGRRNAYHLELFSSCVNLEKAEGLAFSGHADRICGAAGDSVSRRDMFGREDTFDYECKIRKVRRLDEEGLYELSILLGKVPPPPPIPEAEIEVPESTPETDPMLTPPPAVEQ